MATPGTTVPMDEYHAALDRRDRRESEDRRRLAEIEAALRKWREMYMIAESDPYREFVSVPMPAFDRLLK